MNTAVFIRVSVTNTKSEVRRRLTNFEFPVSFCKANRYFSFSYNVGCAFTVCRSSTCDSYVEMYSKRGCMHAQLRLHYFSVLSH